MPPFQYYNRTAPFWDFVASLEDQGASHPWFSGNTRGDNTEGGETRRPNPWTDGWGVFPFETMPHRGGQGRPQQQSGPSTSTEEATASTAETKNAEAESSGARDVPTRDNGHPQAGPSDRQGPGSRRGGRCGGRGRGADFGQRGRGGPRGGFSGFPLGGLGALADMFQNQLSGDDDKDRNAGDENFTPEVDIFDTPESYVVHVSLPGAKKEDVGVNWDAEKSELSIAGVSHRPGDEEFLKTLAMDERKVGAFERKVRLGSRANPAQIDMDGITAKMEDGVLRIDVPKQDSGYVEIRKVDIE